MDRTEFLNNVLSVFKLLLGILLVFFVVAVTKSFVTEVSVLEASFIRAFIIGIVSFLVLYLFIWQPQAVYEKGQHIFQVIFSFFAPLVKVASYALPIYTILVFVVSLTLFFIKGAERVVQPALFLTGFSLSLHLVFSGTNLRPKEIDLEPIAHYLFTFTVVYILNIFLCAWFFSLMRIEFSFSSFFFTAVDDARQIYGGLFQQLFGY